LSVISWKARHPERHLQAAARQHTHLAGKVARGRAGKDALMPKARSIAGSGMCAGWLQVLDTLERVGFDTVLLRIWATARDKDEIDRLCARARAALRERG
jgi:hypothetical protein